MPASRFLPVALLLLAAPLVAQDSRPPAWTFSLSAGPGLGGPMGQLKDRLIEEAWTDQYCDFRKSDCKTSPTPGGLSIQVSGSLGRRISDLLELKGVVEVGDLGHIIGAKGQREIKANWKTSTLATAVVLRPLPHVRLSGGPMIGLLTRQAVAPAKTNSIHFGMLFEGGLRSSEAASKFAELTVAYRVLPKLPEGPWPGTGQSSQIVGGPTGFSANFSHLTIALGGGVRF